MNAPAEHLQERMQIELLPLLQALELLINSVRVLRVVQTTAKMSPGFRAELTRWCPDWGDPLAHAGPGSPDSIVLELARVAGNVGRDLAGADTKGGAA